MTAIELEKPMTANLDRMAKAVGDARKDGLIVDFSRLICTHYGRMVEHFAALEGHPVSAHNNKTVFLEGIDLWCRAFLSDAPRPANGATEDPAVIIEHVMKPWYEALSMDDPSRYVMRPSAPPPAYVGDPTDAVCVALGACACLDVTPIKFRFGLRNGNPERVWGKVYADGKWYDTDVTDSRFALGEHAEFDGYEETEVPL